MLSKYVCVFVSCQLSKGQSLILNVGVGIKVRGQFCVQHSSTFSLVWRRHFQVSTSAGSLENGKKKNNDILSKSSAPTFFLAVFAKNFHVKAAMKTSVLLMWEIPESYNPAQPFTVSIASLFVEPVSTNIIYVKHFLISLIRSSTTTGRVWRWMGS